MSLRAECSRVADGERTHLSTIDIYGEEVSRPVRGLIATVIFVLSHVRPYPPFVWPMQLVFASVYGVLYALMYHRTRSLLGPALAHGYSNTAYVAMMLLKYA